MSLKRIFFVIVFFMLVFSVKVNAATNVDIDVSKIAENFNNSVYVSKLAELGEVVSAKQDSDGITLSYGSDNVVFVFKTNEVLSATYPFSDKFVRKKCDVLCAIFIDTISTMQGKEPGELIAFALDDSFCYTTLSDDGIAKNYLSDVLSNTVVNFEINPYVLFPSASSSNPIKENDFLAESDTFYPDVDCFVKKEDLVFFKSFSENGDMELFIGRSGELDVVAYDSILNAVDILFKDERASKYFRQCYDGFSVGNYEFDGVSVSTDVTDFPVSNVDTALLPLDMRFAKFTINREVVKEDLKSVQLSDPDVGDSTGGKQSFSLPLVIGLSVMGLLIVLLVVFVFRNVIKK